MIWTEEIILPSPPQLSTILGYLFPTSLIILWYLLKLKDNQAIYFRFVESFQKKGLVLWFTAKITICGNNHGKLSFLENIHKIIRFYVNLASALQTSAGPGKNIKSAPLFLAMHFTLFNKYEPSLHFHVFHVFHVTYSPLHLRVLRLFYAFSRLNFETGKR